MNSPLSLERAIFLLTPNKVESKLLALNKLVHPGWGKSPTHNFIYH